MTRRKTLTDAGVAALKPKVARYTYPDPELRGHYIRIMPSGAKAFVAVSRDPAGKQIWTTIGGTDLMNVEAAREAARAAIRRIKEGLPPVELKAVPSTFKDVADAWMKRHVVAKGLISERDIRRLLDKLVLPAWGSREFASVKRSDVASLLDAIEDRNGGRQADMVLALVRGIMNWHATRDDDYVSPIVRGMRRTEPKSRARERILGDDEIQTLWAAAGDFGTFGAMLRFALLTGQRRDKVKTIRWDAVSEDGIWTVPSEEREKGTGGDLKLSALALEIVRSQPRIGDNPYVFAGRGAGHFNGMSKSKAAFDERVPLEPWVLHDLRRTARSLMSRVGVSSEIAERVLGHVIGGVEGVYDRHHYRDEKADALAKLSRLIESIIRPADNVVPLVRAS